MTKEDTLRKTISSKMRYYAIGRLEYYGVRVRGKFYSHKDTAVLMHMVLSDLGYIKN